MQLQMLFSSEDMPDIYFISDPVHLLETVRNCITLGLEIVLILCGLAPSFKNHPSDIFGR